MYFNLNCIHIKSAIAENTFFFLFYIFRTFLFLLAKLKYETVYVKAKLLSFFLSPNKPSLLVGWTGPHQHYCEIVIVEP